MRKHSTVVNTDLALCWFGEGRCLGQATAIFKRSVRDQVMRVDGDVARNDGKFVCLAAARALIPPGLSDRNAGCNPEEPRKQPGCLHSAYHHMLAAKLITQLSGGEPFAP